jgi:glycosyltransferase involved in cell wall biosynthesis
VTGVQRVARGLVRQLLAEAEPEEVSVVGGPPGFGRPVGAIRRTRVGRLLGEQTLLPAKARHARVVMNLGNLAPLASRKNLVLTYDLHALRHPAHYRPAWGPVYWRLSAQAYRRARFRITLSRTIANDLEATLGGHVDAVIPPGIDRPFRPAAVERVEEVRQRLGLPGPYLTVVGWAQPGKRAALAIEAHRLLTPDVPHHLVLVGAGRADFPPVALGELPSTVVMPGRLADEDLAALHTGSAGLLFCTEYEGFGLPPVEAMACGSAVAASRIPVLEEVLGGLPDVCFVEAADARTWADAAGTLLTAALAEGHRAAHPTRVARSTAVLDRYPWEGKGRALLDLVLA